VSDPRHLISNAKQHSNISFILVFPTTPVHLFERITSIGLVLVISADSCRQNTTIQPALSFPMSTRYAPLPNPRSDDDELDNEMEAAFDDPEDDDEQIHISHPEPSLDRPQDPHTAPSLGGYDFENVDYDYPPPGSPPRPSALALPNNYGNSNGLVPSFDASTSQARPRRSWFKSAAAAVLPAHYMRRLGLGARIPSGPVGGGTLNDGVFANVTAKPTSFVVQSEPGSSTDTLLSLSCNSLFARSGESPYLVPEDTRQEAPPSYAVAQADAVPSYWETTIHAPYSPDHPGEIIIDELPTGTVFSFMWNMLVTVSFQFVGFLLTYLLHTTHAARLGSRAGLGVILIQYGFALRGKGDTVPIGVNCPALSSAEPVDASEAESLYKDLCGVDELRNDQLNKFIADATKQWLSFFLMTVGGCTFS
jgi:hypothetical protein